MRPNEYHCKLGSLTQLQIIYQIMQNFKLVCITTLMCITLLGCKDSGSGSGGTENLEPSLRNSPPYPFGAAIQIKHLNDVNYVNLLKEEFNSITGEYQMKMSPMYNNPDAINFSDSDTFVEFAEQTEGRVHGHALLWHSATPSWIENFNGSDSEFETLIENYVKAVVGRYKGRIASWDVVNEAIEDGNGNGLRNSVFRQKIGDDYIAKAFRWAREADPDVLLFYNDYNMAANGGKFNAMLTLVDDLIAENVPIDGVGFQMHISNDWPTQANIEASSSQVIARGLMLHYSELDVKVNSDKSATSFTPELAETQKQRIKTIVDFYNTIPEGLQFGITMWGIKDDDSWLLSFLDNENEWPLLFDENFNAKPAYDGILELFE